MPDFQDYLRANALAPEKNIPFLALWADKYLDFLARHPAMPPEERLERFLAEFSDRAKDWQIRQAATAVHLYTSHFQGPQEPSAAGKRVVNWDQALRSLQDIMRLRHYSGKTEKSYMGWALRFRAYAAGLKKAAPGDCGRDDVRNFLSHLAMTARVSASSQNQAFNALVFFFREVLGEGLAGLGATVRARRGERVPVVLTVEEVRALLAAAEGKASLLMRLIYGAGLRLSEAVRLRVKDADLDAATLTIHGGKGDKDRTTVLPRSLSEDLRKHMAGVKALHGQDLARGFGEAPLPEALARKYPNAGREWGWQFLFPSADLSVDPSDGRPRRWHMSEKTVQNMVRDAARRAGLVKHATVHTLRHSFATHLLMQGVNIREVQDLLGHKNVETTMVYTHVLRNMAGAPRSPLDRLAETVEARGA